jgi:hypothetical protein
MLMRMNGSVWGMSMPSSLLLVLRMVWGKESVVGVGVVVVVGETSDQSSSCRLEHVDGRVLLLTRMGDE